MNDLVRDLRYAARSLIRYRGFTAVALVMLALGIGGTTAIYAAVSETLLRPLPYRDAERLIRLWETYSQGGRGSVSMPNFEDWRAQSALIEELTAIEGHSYNLAVPAPARIPGVLVTADFFRLFGVTPTLGRTLVADDFKADSPRVVILGHDLWQRQLGGDPAVLGRVLDLGGVPYTVVGVLPRSFRPPINNGTELITAMEVKPRSRNNHGLGVAGKLKAGVTVEQARAEMIGIAAGIGARYPDQASRSVYLTTIQDSLVGGSRAALVLLLVAVVMVLLIACANVANLLLVRARAREEEIAIRMALGASPGRIVRQLLTESLLLGLLGGLLGVAIPLIGLDALSLGMPRELKGIVELHIDGGVLAFTAAASVGSVFLFGLAPAVAAAHGGIASAMRAGATRASAGRSRLKSALVVTEVALSLVLDVGSGLLVRSLLRLQEVELGFRPQRVLTMRMALPDGRYDTDPKIAGFYQQLVARVERLPGVISAAVINDVPFSLDNRNGTFSVEGHPDPAGPPPSAEFLVISPRYFETLGIHVDRGRPFDGRDGAGAPPVVIINETFARKYLPGEEPLGQHVNVMGAVREVVGVVGDVRRFGLLAQPAAETYAPHPQVAMEMMYLAVKTAGDPMRLVPAVRGALESVDPSQAVFDVSTMEQMIAASLAQRRFQTTLLGLFGAVSLILAALGTYGVISYEVGRRTREIGIRIALGALPWRVQWMVIRQGMAPALLGVVVGLALTVVVSRLLETLVYGITTTDVSTYLGTAAVLSAVAFLACALPARAAGRVEPMVAMRTPQ